MNVMMIPSVDGGMGHIARTATLARMLIRLDPTVKVEYLLDTERLRPFNIDATARTGFRVNLLPPRPRDRRDAIVRAGLGDADVIVDDTSRYLIPLRRIVPRAAWISLPMYPLGDELFNDWPHLVQTDGIIWAYPPVLDFPPELELSGTKVLRTGPFFDFDDVPEREAARARLGFGPDEEVLIYAPRGMSFGREFGERVLAGVVGGAAALRKRRKRIRLVLLAVSDPEELRAPGVPARLPAWVTVVGVVPPAEMTTYLRAADIAVTEGSNMTQEAAALGTPILMVPGAIYETWLLGTRLYEHRAAHIIWIERVTTAAVAETFDEILTDVEARAAMTERARALVTGGSGVRAAACLVLEIAATYQNVATATHNREEHHGRH